MTEMMQVLEPKNGTGFKPLIFQKSVYTKTMESAL